jgi:hypothetical protein
VATVSVALTLPEAQAGPFRPALVPFVGVLSAAPTCIFCTGASAAERRLLDRHRRDSQ